MEDHIPEDHLLRLVDRHIDFAFVRETLKASYSRAGRPSIDPEVLLRILLVGYLYRITSERRLVEASPDRTITREQLQEVAKVNRTVREYVEQVERENVSAEQAQTENSPMPEAEGEPELRRTYRNSPPMKISTTDPEAAPSSKRGASEFAYYDNYLIDNRSCIIAGVMATPARLSQEIIAGSADVGKSKRTVRAVTRQHHC